MNDAEILEICSSLYDRITLIKGYLEFNQRQKVDYSLVILKEINIIEVLVNDIVDKVKA